MNAETVLSFLVNASILGSLTILAVMLLRGLFHHWLPVDLLSFAWLLVGLRLLLPLKIASPVSLLNWQPALNELFFEERTTPTEANEGPLVFEYRPLGWATEPPVAELSATPQTSSSPVWQIEPLHAIGLVWMAGFLGCTALAFFAHGHFRRRLLDEDVACSSGSVKAKNPSRCPTLLAEATRSIGLKKPLSLQYSQDIPGPCLCGIWHPVIVLPTGLAPTLSDEELRLIFRHELTHARHCDHWLQALLGFAAACHWFNPLVWWARRACQSDCELTTDASLTRHADGGERETYGSLLLKMTRHTRSPLSSFALRHSALPFGLPMAASSKRSLKNRITMINHPQPNRPLARFNGVLLLGITALAACTSAVEPKPYSTKKQAEAAPQIFSTNLSKLTTTSPKQMEVTEDGKIQVAYHDFKPGQDTRHLFETELVIAEIEDLDVLLKELPQSETRTYDSMEPIFQALRAVDAEVLSAPRLVTEEGKQATIRIGEHVLDEQGSSERVSGIQAELVILPDTSRSSKAFGANPTFRLKGHAVVGENILVDAQGQLLDSPSGGETIAINQDYPHPLGKVRIFGGIHSLKNNQIRTNKHIVVFARVSEWEPEEAATVKDNMVSQIDSYLSSQLQGKNQPMIVESNVEVLGQAFQIRLFEHPIEEHTAAPRTIASRVFRFQTPRAFQVAWKIEEGNLILDTDAAKGTIHELPEGFVIDQLQRDASIYQIGHFKRDGRDWRLLLEIQHEAIVRAQALGQGTTAVQNRTTNGAENAASLKEQEVSKRIIQPSNDSPDRLSLLRARLDTLEMQRVTLAQRYAHTHPKMIETQAAIDAIKEQIKADSPRYVAVLGLVEHQGRVALDPGKTTISLTEAIAKAGGLKHLDHDTKVVIRPADGTPLEVDFRAILYGKANPVQLQHGAVIYVPERPY